MLFIHFPVSHSCGTGLKLFMTHHHSYHMMYDPLMLEHTSNASRTGIRLNLGSGSRPIQGYTNVDILPMPGVDVVCDLEVRLPFDDNSVMEVTGEHVLEHINNFVPLMQELHRICANGAELHFRIPYYTSESAFKDPTHVRYMSERTFSYFSRRAQKDEHLPDYNLDMDFEILGFDYLYHRRWFALPIVRTVLKRYCWNIVKTMIVALRVVKPTRSL